MSVLGALIMYIVSMLALFRLRRTEPDMQRPFRAIGYPLLPLWALGASFVCLASLVYYNRAMSLLFLALLAIGYLYFRLTGSSRTPESGAL
jgi:ethanolamine permease